MNTFQRRLVWSSSILTGATGGVYWWMKNMLQPVDPWAAINHPLQPWVLKAHILVAPVMVFAVGLIAAEHIWRHWRQGVTAGRRSGLAAMWCFLPMVLSGYLIQAVTDVGWLGALAWIHLGAGAVYLAGLLAHHPVVRRLATPSVRPGGRPHADQSWERASHGEERERTGALVVPGGATRTSLRDSHGRWRRSRP